MCCYVYHIRNQHPLTSSAMATSRMQLHPGAATCCCPAPPLDPLATFDMHSTVSPHIFASHRQPVADHAACGCCSRTLPSSSAWSLAACFPGSCQQRQATPVAPAGAGGSAAVHCRGATLPGSKAGPSDAGSPRPHPERWAHRCQALQRGPGGCVPWLRPGGCRDAGSQVHPCTSCSSIVSPDAVSQSCVLRRSVGALVRPGCKPEASCLRLTALQAYWCIQQQHSETPALISFIFP